MWNKKFMCLMVFSGISSMVIGLPYILKIFSSVKTELTSWGIASVFIGFLLIASAVAVSHINTKIIRAVLALEYSVLVLLQVPPVMLWLSENSTYIAVGTGSGQLAGHWAFSIPHLVLMLMGVAVIYRMLQFNLSQLEAE
ncbi:small-conductance mechanosensitive channel [Desulfohalotomaculum tongense]|uniref:hypothetical protein n=1 Tax=Desulforadius tongensis TaxID=1216062 RepID=UPI00195F0B0C|nr:hypothetical protein [Desulforadius tongensis]MBM7854325.1 small-conductance mechanosensitive channel [Desulforadius tongensis]